MTPAVCVLARAHAPLACAGIPVCPHARALTHTQLHEHPHSRTRVHADEKVKLSAASRKSYVGTAGTYSCFTNRAPAPPGPASSLSPLVWGIHIDTGTVSILELNFFCTHP